MQWIELYRSSKECPIYDPRDSKGCTYVSITATTNGDDTRVHKDNGNYPFKHTHTHTCIHLELNRSRLYSLHTWFFIKQISPRGIGWNFSLRSGEITTPRGVVLCRREKFKRRQQNNFRRSRRNVIRHNSCWELIALERFILHLQENSRFKFSDLKDTFQ